MPSRPTGPMGRWRVALEARPGRTLALVGVACALLYSAAFVSGASAGDVIRGDAVQYFAYLRSAVFDRDLDFENEYERFYPDETSVWRTTRTPAGRPPNMMSIGPALLWSPAYLTAGAIAWLLSLVGLARPPDGYSLALQLSAGLAGVAYATAGAYCCYRAAALRFPAPAALWGAVTAWLAGPALYYTLVSPAYSHATTMFTTGLFVWIWMRRSGQFDPGRFVVLGLLAGLAALVRWQDAVLVVVPAIELLDALGRRAVSLRTVSALALSLAAGLAVTLVPQLLAWEAIYGSYFTVPQGSGFMRWAEPAVLPVLFSARRGLFVWTPALLLGTVGLLWLWRRDRLTTVSMAILLGISIYVNASVADWWAGEAFGARRFISVTPVFAIGLTAVWTALGARRPGGTIATAAAALVVYNALFLLQYQLFMRGHRDLVSYPTTFGDVLVERLILPFRLVWRWLSG